MKGEVLRQLLWSVGFDSIPKGEGWYSLSISDTTFAGRPAKYVYSQGFVPRRYGGYVERDIELFADLSPAAFEYALFGMHDINAQGNPSVCGLIHANGDVNSGGSSVEQIDDSCRGGDDHISEGFLLYPPGMRTSPIYYPKTTYYYVVGRPGGGNAADILRYDPTGSLPGSIALRGGILANPDLDP